MLTLLPKDQSVFKFAGTVSSETASDALILVGGCGHGGCGCYDILFFWYRRK